MPEELFVKKSKKKVVKHWRRWRVEYRLVYDDGQADFDLYYKTRFGAKVCAWYHKYIRSWGGTAILFDQWDFYNEGDKR